MTRAFLLSLLLQPGQTEFVPVTELPPGEQLPAAPLLIAAYAVVWVAVFVYVWMMWRRVGKVEKDLNALAEQISRNRP